MKYCPYCGKRLSVDNVCRRCGRNVDKAQGYDGFYTAKVPNGFYPCVSEKMKKQGIFTLVFASIALLFALACFICPVGILPFGIFLVFEILSYKKLKKYFDLGYHKSIFTHLAKIFIISAFALSVFSVILKAIYFVIIAIVTSILLIVLL